jgi:phosphoglycolate phosphatase
MKKIQKELLIFDLDGTLVDSRQDLANAVNYARSKFNLQPLPMPFIASHIGYGVNNLLAHTIPDLNPAQVDEARVSFKEHYEIHVVDETVLYPGVKETLEYFRNKKLAIVSNKPIDYLPRILGTLGIKDYFQIIFGENSYPDKKPHPGPLLAIMKDLDCNPNQSCMIGDWITDVEAGKRAGITTVGCLYGIGEITQLKEFKPDYLIESFSQLKDIIE